MNEESVHVFQCGGDELVGIYHPAQTGEATVGVLIVVGGPQYRVGSHRMFVRLGRALSTAGFAAFRFDYRGMGDSDGAPREFDTVDDDIRAAIDQMYRNCPTLQKVVIFGLCDAASAALIYLPADERVAGAVLLNPWVRSTVGASRARLWHYYPRRLIDPAMWRKILSGQFAFGRSVAGLVSTLGVTLGFRSRSGDEEQTFASDQRFVDRMRYGLETFTGKSLILLSEDDLTAQEFAELRKSDRLWLDLCANSRVESVAISKADHTLSDAGSFDAFLSNTIVWLRQEVESVGEP